MNIKNELKILNIHTKKNQSEPKYVFTVYWFKLSLTTSLKF